MWEVTRAGRGKQTCRTWPAASAARTLAVFPAPAPSRRPPAPAHVRGGGSKALAHAGPVQGMKAVRYPSALQRTLRQCAPLRCSTGRELAKGCSMRGGNEETGLSGRPSSRPPWTRGRERPHSGRRPQQGRSASGLRSGRWLDVRHHERGRPWRPRSGTTSWRSRSRQVAAGPHRGRWRRAATTSSPQPLGLGRVPG